MQMTCVSAYEQVVAASRELTDSEASASHIGLEFLAVALDFSSKSDMVGELAFLQMGDLHSRLAANRPLETLSLVESVEPVVVQCGAAVLGGKGMDGPSGLILIIGPQLKWLDHDQHPVDLVHLLAGLQPEDLLDGHLAGVHRVDDLVDFGTFVTGDVELVAAGGDVLDGGGVDVDEVEHWHFEAGVLRVHC